MGVLIVIKNAPFLKAKIKNNMNYKRYKVVFYEKKTKEVFF